MTTLIDAINFVMPACKESALPYSQFLIAKDNWLIGFDGVLTIGHPIDEDLRAAPVGDKFKEAIGKAKENYSVTQLDSGKLSIKSGRSKLLVPCAILDDMPTSMPDTRTHDLHDGVKAGFAALLHLAEANATHLTLASILLQNGSLCATNRIVAIEFWHGDTLPCQLLIPREACAVVAKSKLTLEGLGFNKSSATFYFENGAFVKTQIYQEQPLDIVGILNKYNDEPLTNIPKEFFEDVKSLLKFSADNKILFDDGKIYVQSDKGDVSEIEYPEMKKGLAVNAECLLHLKNIMTSCAFTNNIIFMFGENMRGAIGRIPN